jgi:diguanylate cyclase (GGDEF)-like protein
MIAVGVFAFVSVFSQAEQMDTMITSPSTYSIAGLGKGTASLNGLWRFHPGDDPSWAAAGFDDSKWERLTAEKSWGEQGHARYTGFAWYRCQLALTPARGIPPQFALLLSDVDDAYEIYWDGKLIGSNGRLQPSPVWYYSRPAQIFNLGQLQRGVLAVRVWKAPLLSDDSGQSGGFESAPIIGSPDAIANAKAALDYQWLSGRQFLFGESLIYALIALMSFLLWCRNPSRRLLFWMTGFALVPPVNVLLLSAHLPLPYVVAMGVDQPLASIRDISLWFLLLWLLRLHENRPIALLTRIIAWICFINATLDGILVAISWRPRWTELCQAADATSTSIYLLLEAFPLVLAGYALLHRRPLDTSRWLVAGVAFINQMLILVRNVTKQGRQFTNWSFASKIDSPLFTLGGTAISLYTLAGAFLLVSIIYAVYESIRADQRRQDALEREKLELTHAREQMRYHAEHDDLTGLWNHRIIVERLRAEVNRSHRDGTPLSVILADVDHFKKVNDNFGHHAGDLVLKELGKTFTRSVRAYDWVGRYGGEEFLIILPGSGIENALDRAEELRRAVQDANITDGELTIQVSASFGVASDFPSSFEAEAVIQTVDAALYGAKKSGRNCVVAAEAGVPLSDD